VMRPVGYTFQISLSTTMVRRVIRPSAYVI